MTSHLQAHVDSAVFVRTVKRETKEIEASASPRNPKVAMDFKSSNVESFEVVCRSQRISRSAFCKREAVNASAHDSRGNSSLNVNAEALQQAHANANAIILNLQQLHPSILDRDLDGLRASIEAVLDELLDRVRRPLDDLNRRASSVGSARAARLRAEAFGEALRADRPLQQRYDSRSPWSAERSASAPSRERPARRPWRPSSSNASSIRAREELRASQ